MVRYKHVLIAGGTKAAELLAKKNFKELDKHLRECEEAQRKLEGRENDTQ